MQFTINDQQLRRAVEIVKEELGIELVNNGIAIDVRWIDAQRVTVTPTDEKIILEAKDIPHALQAIWQLSHGKKAPFDWNYHFKRNGLMLDNSRNAVANVEMVKYLLRKMAVMGHTWYMLYMEDTYEIPEQPYFGAYRGRYSQKDLKELNDYADCLGIELVPCIQTLAHLNQFFEWEHEHSNYVDIDDILNVGREKTKQLIRQMLTSLRECFTTETIHLGMDEAYNLGRGSFLTEFGLQDKTAIMQNHLNFMLDLCKEIGWKPMVWDDMFFSWYNTLDNLDDFKVPDGIELMYWDYYNEHKEHYVERIQTRSKITSQLHFAGGAWRWTGYVPHHKKTLYSTLAALAACKEQGVEKVIATAWGDDSSEAPFYTVLFGLTLYSLLDSQDYDELMFSQWLQAYSGMDLEQWLWQGEFDLLPEFNEMKALDVTTSKYLLYQDLLMPLFMEQIKTLEVDYGQRMQELKIKLSELTAGESLINQFYVEYANVLEIKWNLPLRIWQAYHDKDYIQLKDIAMNILPDLHQRLENLCEARRRVWLWEANPQGLEIIEHRFGSMMMRANTTAKRLMSYINGEVDSLEELEEIRLDGSPRANRAEKQAINYNRALRIMSRSRSTW